MVLDTANERDNPHTLASFKDSLSDHFNAGKGKHEEETGDENAAHGYEQNGDVEKQGEQTAKEREDQADFDEANPDAEALSHRERDENA